MALYDLFGYLGFLSLVVCWLPQTFATIKTGIVGIRKSFLVLFFLGQSLLMLQAIGLHNVPLIILNGYLMLASAVNVYYGFFPRISTK